MVEFYFTQKKMKISQRGPLNGPLYNNGILINGSGPVELINFEFDYLYGYTRQQVFRRGIRYEPDERLVSLSFTQQN